MHPAKVLNSLYMEGMRASPFQTMAWILFLLGTALGAQLDAGLGHIRVATP